MAYQPKSYRKFVATAATATLVAGAIAPIASAAFSDVSDKYKDAVDYLVSKGANGLTETSFGVSEEITRVDAAVLIVKVLGLDIEAAPASGFTDVPARAAKYVNALKAAGITSGKTATSFDASSKITRGELAVWIQKGFDLKGDGSVNFTDVSDRYKEAVSALVANKITNGTAADKFGTTQTAKRGDYAIFLYKAANDVTPVAPEVKSVSAINATTAKVTFKNPVSELDFTNFTISGGLTVVKATLSADKKSAEVVVNNAFTRNQEYTLTATGFKNAEGEAYPDSTGKFTWAVQDGVTVALTKGTLTTIGATSGISVLDQDGKAVSGASVAVTSSNTNIVTATTDGTVDGTDITAVAEGTADVTVTVTLADGTVLTNTFVVTVAVAADQVANQGYTLVADVTDLAETPQNTVAFNAASKTTSMYANTSKEVAMFDTVNKDPQTEAIDFTGATVKSVNPIIATADVTGAVLTVTANAGQQGKASFEVTLADKTKRTFTVDVKKEAALAGITTNVTTVKLSDEEVNAGTVEGINQKTVTVNAIDQFGDNFAFGTVGKVTVTTNTDGLVIGGTGAGNTIDFNAGADTTDTFTVTSTKDKIVNGTVSVKYFKNASDTTPTMTKTISVNVVNVDTTATPTGLDIVAASEIDVNAPNTVSTTDVDSIDFATAKIYSLDSKGNRLEDLSTTATATLVGSDDYVEVDTNALQFQGNDELTLLTASSTVNVDVLAGGITKRLPIKYINSASVPASATVNTKPVAVKLTGSDTTLSIEELIFGKLDSTQLIEDADLSEYIAVKSAATNGGYKYNKSLVAVKDAKGNALVTGAPVYGIDNTATTGNIWIDEDQLLGFSDENFAVDFSVANVSTTGTGSLSTTASLLSDVVGVPAVGDSVTFTLVIKSLYVEGASATDNNLLAAPVTVNVTVTK
ncbi:S-layer homology domain-containing protein [Peribacillus huizhouensis]|uniref:SLH domain-containing protein n=1 Tax=Peribacillus huizhouensis TaxID=1501239 RepID=A0ABR6CP11_9BACI|nr:S-layer homology domain-containing protein [Peribacillus huizhouensis]MBA9026679.1 hypothetical protein [Peribacillus huizhouensis]